MAKNNFDRGPEFPPCKGYHGSYYWNGTEHTTEEEAWENYRDWLSENTNYIEGHQKQYTF